MTAATLSPLWTGEPYLSTGLVLHVIAYGIPAPQGSKSFRGKRRDGSAILTESSKALKPWRAHVQAAIETAIKASPDPSMFPLLGPIRLDIVFTVPKPKSAPKTRVTYPIVKPDKDKLERAVLDAGSFAALYADDAQVVAGSTYKVYPAETPRSLTRPGVTIAVHTLSNPTSPALPQRSALPL